MCYQDVTTGIKPYEIPKGTSFEDLPEAVNRIWTRVTGGE
jgi:hypothetical protein